VDGRLTVNGRKLDIPRKPEPGYYKGVAALMGVDPQNAVVVEDAPKGVRGAKADGFKLIIGLARGNTREEIDQARADLENEGANIVLEGLNEMTIEQILENVPGLEAIIFDSDGVIVNTEPLHFQAEKMVLEAFLHYREEKFGDTFRGLTQAEYDLHSKSQNTAEGFRSILSDRGIYLDHAQTATGGIDLTSDKALTVQNSGQGIKFYIDPAQLKELEDAPGFVPVIISIRPMTNIRMFLGLNTAVKTVG
jgi:beta-phosphoglucomutase-like phosphatase (HAD superfamily)